MSSNTTNPAPPSPAKSENTSPISKPILPPPPLSPLKSKAADTSSPKTPKHQSTCLSSTLSTPTSTLNHPPPLPLRTPKNSPSVSHFPCTPLETWPSFYLHSITEYLLYIFLSENQDWEFLLSLSCTTLLIQWLININTLHVPVYVNINPNTRPRWRWQWREKDRNSQYVIKVLYAIAMGAVVARVPYWVSCSAFAFLLGGESVYMGIEKYGKGFLSGLRLEK